MMGGQIDYFYLQSGRLPSPDGGHLSKNGGCRWKADYELCWILAFNIRLATLGITPRLTSWEALSKFGSKDDIFLTGLLVPFDSSLLKFGQCFRSKY